MLSSRLLLLPIISIQTGGHMGRVTSAIIDPRQLKIIAFRCEGPAIQIDPAILHSEDIREVSNLGLIINSTDNIMAVDDLVRLKEVMDLDFKLEDKLVVEESGHKIGKVTAYSVEVSSFYIIKLHVKPGLISSFKTTERIIDRNQIVEITPEKVVVKSATVKEEKPAAVRTMPVVENPFRRTTAQPDMSNQPD